MKKKRLALVLAFLVIASIALAAGGSLSIKSSQKLDTQFKAFRAYLDSLPHDKRAAWLSEISAIIQEEQGQSAFSRLSLASFDEDIMVWIPKSGKKYHATSTCSNMKSPTQITREAALSRGFEPCKRCKPQ